MRGKIMPNYYEKMQEYEKQIEFLEEKIDELKAARKLVDAEIEELAAALDLLEGQIKAEFPRDEIVVKAMQLQKKFDANADHLWAIDEQLDELRNELAGVNMLAGALEHNEMCKDHDKERI